MQAWKEYQQEHKDRFLNELLDLLRIPSVSARGEHKEDMIRCAEAVEKSLKKQGDVNTAIWPTPVIPAVLVRKIIYPQKIPPFMLGPID
ncbi:MAG: hypothetical protein IBJ16_14760 [Chitinophagaceae bacterium]|nr:hypothetical protein [Chitinophagaceae bacterium]